MATGRGSSLGAALADLFAQGGRGGAARSTYTRVGWRAQFAQLSSTKAGYAAMEAAGVEATVETQQNWLRGRSEARPKTQGLIAQAYKAMQGGWNPRWETATYAISGQVTIGADSRVRGQGRHAPLRVNGARGRWDEIADEWNGDADHDELEQLFITNVIMEDLGFSDPPEFDGNWYEVTA